MELRGKKLEKMRPSDIPAVRENSYRENSVRENSVRDNSNQITSDGPVGYLVNDINDNVSGSNVIVENENENDTEDENNDNGDDDEVSDNNSDDDPNIRRQRALDAAMKRKKSTIEELLD
jgi:hypothetical protein